MTLFKKIRTAEPRPTGIRELTDADLRAVAGGRRMLNPQPLPPYAPGY